MCQGALGPSDAAGAPQIQVLPQNPKVAGSNPAPAMRESAPNEGFSLGARRPTLFVRANKNTTATKIWIGNRLTVMRKGSGRAAGGPWLV
jgi:hypothetical protein